MRFLALLFFTLHTMAFAQAQENELEKGERLFSLKVRSILENKCFACHGGKKKVKGDLNLTSRAGLLKGGETAYEVLVPFKPEKSMMVTAIEWADEDYEMPPKESDRLSAEQITQVKSWILLGAPWPTEAKQKKYRLAERSRELTEDGLIIRTSGGLSEDWTWRRYQPADVWAFLPLKKTEPPEGRGNPIDRFIQAGLTKAGLKPAPWGDALTLIRRAAYDLTGLPPTPAEIDALEQIARQNRLNLIFDAAHGFGARYRGTPVGGQGDAHVYSLSPTKLLIAGEGGIVATDNDELAEHIRMGREYGNNGAYDSAFAGMNARLAEFNALLGLRSLDMLEQAAARRNEVVALYHRELGDLPGIGFQKVDTENRCSYKDFSITIDPDAFGMSRDEVAELLAAANIDTRKYYDPPVHRQQAYRQFASPDRPLPHTEWLSDHSLSLPVWSHMDEEIVLGICEAVHRIYRTAPAVSL